MRLLAFYNFHLFFSVKRLFQLKNKNQHRPTCPRVAANIFVGPARAKGKATIWAKKKPLSRGRAVGELGISVLRSNTDRTLTPRLIRGSGCRNMVDFCCDVQDFFLRRIP